MKKFKDVVIRIFGSLAQMGILAAGEKQYQADYLTRSLANRE